MMPKYINADWLLERAVPHGWSTPLWVSDIAIKDAPAADVVERKDLDKITETHEKIGYEKGYRDGYAQATEDAIEVVGINTWAGSRITKLHPAQPEPRWISVTERLPEADKRVLICNDEERYLVGFIKSWKRGNEWSYQLDMNNYDAYDEQEQGKLVAWMPLPEPYRKETENG